MKSRIKYLTIVAAFAITLSLAVTQPSIASAPNPTPIDLGVLEGCTMSRAHAVNASGQVVGMSWTPRGPDDGVLPMLPFIWSGGVMTQLPLPEGYSAASAESINASAQIAGSCWYYVGPEDPATSEMVYTACLWTRDGGEWTVTPLGVPDPYTIPITDETGENLGSLSVEFGRSQAYRINDAGQVLVVLEAFITGFWNSTEWCAAIWQDGNWTLPKYPETGAAIPIPLYGIPEMNENGQVLLPMEHYAEEGDTTLYLWDAGTTTEIAGLVRCANLNNAGQIVGWHYTDTSYSKRENFIYDSGALLTSPVLDGGDGYFLLNINDSGQIVVAYPMSEGSTELGIISFDKYRSDPDQVTRLGVVPGHVDHWSVKINAAGEVSGCGYGDPAFFASVDSGVVLLDSLAGGSTLTTAMNDSGAVVGYSGTSIGTDHATMWGIVSPADDTDGDGVPDDVDQCPDSLDVGTTIKIDRCDTGVPNVVFDDGCTISDLIADIAENARYQAGFVLCVTRLTNDLRRQGVLTWKQALAIQRCAVRARVLDWLGRHCDR